MEPRDNPEILNDEVKRRIAAWKQGKAERAAMYTKEDEVIKDFMGNIEELPISTDRLLELLEKEEKLHKAEIQLAAWEIFRKGLGPNEPDNPNRLILRWCPPQTEIN
jgi:hypothetical protein